MGDQIELKVVKSAKIFGWVLSALSLSLLLIAAIIYRESASEVVWISWMAYGALLLAVFLIPYINHIRGVIITNKDVTVNILYKGRPIPFEEIEEVHFISKWGFPKKGKNIVNIDTKLDNHKAAAEFLKGKVKVTGMESIQ